MPRPATNAAEDHITLALCHVLRQSRTARRLPFQIHTQQVELDPLSPEETGRLDIVFNVLVPQEDIYFCLEGKRLNVAKDGRTRSYASEYVRLGMMRFVLGKYSRAVHHGGMIGYVMDGNRLALFKRIVANNEILGTVYLTAEYNLLGRLADYAAILTTVLVASEVLRVIAISSAEAPIRLAILARASSVSLSYFRRF